MADSKIKLDEAVDNSERKFGEALKYFPVKIIDTDDNVEWGYVYWKRNPNSDRKS